MQKTIVLNILKLKLEMVLILCKRNERFTVIIISWIMIKAKTTKKCTKLAIAYNSISIFCCVLSKICFEFEKFVFRLSVLNRDFFLPIRTKDVVLSGWRRFIYFHCPIKFTALFESIIWRNEQCWSVEK